jgi:hypothetical protein
MIRMMPAISQNIMIMIETTDVVATIITMTMAEKTSRMITVEKTPTIQDQETTEMTNTETGAPEDRKEEVLGEEVIEGLIEVIIIRRKITEVREGNTMNMGLSKTRTMISTIEQK